MGFQHQLGHLPPSWLVCKAISLSQRLAKHKGPTLPKNWKLHVAKERVFNDGIKKLELVSKSNRPNTICENEFEIIQCVINSMKLGSYYFF